MLEHLDLNAIQDENTRELVVRLLNLIEKLSADLRDAQADIQRLRDEVNRLNGKQGKPRINPNVANPPADHSSEKERHKPRQRSKGSKNANIPFEISPPVGEDFLEDVLLRLTGLRPSPFTSMPA